VPRGFTEQEKINIHMRLIQAGREAFGRYGIKKTNVEELSEKAGISKGAFYGFFPSKEDLYFAVIRHYESGQHEAMTALLSGECDDEKRPF
jgi:AcrR family transcriptional regulator